MEIQLFDHRNKMQCGNLQNLGNCPLFHLTKGGRLKFMKTDLLYSVNVTMSKAEMQALYDRLGEILGKPQNKAPIIKQAEEILKGKKGQ